MNIRIAEKYLQRALEEFDSNPLAAKLMRRLAADAPDSFFPVAMKHLNSREESNGHRLMTILLARQDSLMERLASPAYNSRESAVDLFRRFLAVDPSFDVKLARKLPGRSYFGQEHAFDSSHSARALDILDETSRGRRLLPILGHLPDSSDNRISAKATLFVGRRVQSPVWTRKQLARPDQRIRANAVEALWGVQTPPALTLLEECVGDRNHRVAGNSLVGLHIAGRAEAQPGAMLMSRQGNAEARSTAAWVLGRISAPEFLKRLTEMVRDEHPQVRSSALRALMDVRRREAKRPDLVVPQSGEESSEQVPSDVEKAEVLPESTAPRLNDSKYVVRR